jgi:pimeloyl-ACP methyl ester carboxylesterase
MATFGLVHGAWHGAWCWELLVPELERRGHSAIAMDLPCEDRTASFFDYAEAVKAALGDASDVVLVGHSMAGITIPLVALSRPVQLLVFLCALVPDRAGDPAAGGPQTHPDGAFDALVRSEDGSHAWPSAEAAARTLYQDCRPVQIASAFARLRRQQTALWDSWGPLERWPDVAMASIHCSEDCAVNPAWSSWIARNRLGVESVQLPGGHSPMLARPAALADALVAAAGPAVATSSRGDTKGC